MAKKHVAVSLRKPPSPEKLDAFVAAAAAESEAVPESGTVTVTAPAPESGTVTAPGSASAPAPAPGSAPAPAPASAPGLRPVTVYLAPPLAERLALHCVANDRDASNVIGEALEQHLSRRLGAGSWAPGAGATSRSSADAPPDARSEQAGPFRWEDPRRWADAFAGTRVERLLQVGRVLYGLWQRRRSAS